MLEMPVNVLNMHDHVLADYARLWRTKLSPLTSQHNSAIGDGQLRMGGAGVGSPSAQTLRETESVAEPFDRLLNVLVDEDRYHCRFRRGSVDYHTHLRG